MVSSVKPYDLMMGKILGVGALGLTQILIWLLALLGIVACRSWAVPGACWSDSAAGSRSRCRRSRTSQPTVPAFEMPDLPVGTHSSTSASSFSGDICSTPASSRCNRFAGRAGVGCAAVHDPNRHPDCDLGRCCSCQNHRSARQHTSRSWRVIHPVLLANSDASQGHRLATRFLGDAAFRLLLLFAHLRRWSVWVLRPDLPVGILMYGKRPRAQGH